MKKDGTIDISDFYTGDRIIHENIGRVINNLDSIEQVVDATIMGYYTCEHKHAQFLDTVLSKEDMSLNKKCRILYDIMKTVDAEKFAQFKRQGITKLIQDSIELRNKIAHGVVRGYPSKGDPDRYVYYFITTADRKKYSVKKFLVEFIKPLDESFNKILFGIVDFGITDANAMNFIMAAVEENNE